LFETIFSDSEVTTNNDILTYFWSIFPGEQRQVVSVDLNNYGVERRNDCVLGVGLWKCGSEKKQEQKMWKPTVMES